MPTFLKRIFSSLMARAVLAILTIWLIFFKRPLAKIVASARRLAGNRGFAGQGLPEEDELRQLALVMEGMREEIRNKQLELDQRLHEYLDLFEHVPCIITVQDREYRLIKYNREFADKFKPEPFDFCFRAYKDRDEKCLVCPVEMTFQDGQSHTSEESGPDKEGSMRHWVVRTAPLFNTQGEVVAAMEMCLDITHRKRLEEDLAKSEKKYHAIFNNIPNPVFVLDSRTLAILDCNDSVRTVYGFDRNEIANRPFLDLFLRSDRAEAAAGLRNLAVLNRVKHQTRDGRTIYVNVRVSPSEYPGQKVLLVTTSDITKRLETEQQLIQASKMATLGEMATGVAHELNQPLSVIKTASSFFMRKIQKKEKIEDEIILNLATEIDGHVDRAAKIINHMREFGRKSDLRLEPVQVNDILRRALEIIGQQLKLREIEVIWDLAPDLPLIMADPVPLEQVFINLLINARDAIEEQWHSLGPREGGKKIELKTLVQDGKAVIEVHDNGTGLPESIAGKIFEPFFTTKEVGKGTGLGLSISYRFIQDCCGDIRVLPGEGQGTTFLVEFPLAATRE
ncbi:MAG: PAS domain S-box protein [Thermodesulfobacteriota bacterium]